MHTDDDALRDPHTHMTAPKPPLPWTPDEDTRFTLEHPTNRLVVRVPTLGNLTNSVVPLKGYVRSSHLVGRQTPRAGLACCSKVCELLFTNVARVSLSAVTH